MARLEETRHDPSGVHRESAVTRRQILKGAAGVAATAFLGTTLEARGSSNVSFESTPRSKPKRGGTLQLALTDTEASETLDPATAAVSTQFVLAGALYNTLIEEDYTNWSLHPVLAESWEANRDFTKYEIKLRKGVEFHNGKPLTPEDVVWSIERQLNPKVASAAAVRAAMSLSPHSAKASGKSTVILNLTRADSQLPYLLSRPFLAIVPAGQTKFTVANAHGTGPFKLDEWQPATNWKVSRNKNYWESGHPYLDGIDMVVNTDSTARLEGVVTGQFDLAEEIEYSSARSVINNSNVKILTFDKGINRVIVMDCSVKPFSDPRVRLAFKLAMNRQLAVKSVYADFAVPTSDLPMPPSDPYYPPHLGVRHYDPAQARSLLKEAGYPKGMDITLYTSTVVSGMVELAEVFQQSAKSAGIRVNIKEWSPSTYWDDVWLVKPFYTTYWETPYPPDYFWYVYAPKAAYNEAKLKLNEVTVTYNEIMKTGNRAEQIKLSQNLYAKLANDWGHIIPGNVKSPWVSIPKLQGVDGDQPNFRVKLAGAYLET